MQDGCKKLVGSDPFVQCPYNKAHSMPKSRLATHLIKCERSLKAQGSAVPNVPMKRCRFNSSHVVPEPKLQHHEINCEDRKTFDCYKFTPVANSFDPLARTEDQPPSTYEPVESSDNWDDVDVVSYNPEKYVVDTPVIRLKVGAPPAERKEFRKSERMRLMELNK